MTCNALCVCSCCEVGNFVSPKAAAGDRFRPVARCLFQPAAASSDEMDRECDVPVHPRTRDADTTTVSTPCDDPQ